MLNARQKSPRSKDQNRKPNKMPTLQSALESLLKTTEASRPSNGDNGLMTILDGTPTASALSGMISPNTGTAAMPREEEERQIGSLHGGAIVGVSPRTATEA